ncbi:carbohydrate ABC transporter permease [Haloarcula marina]|uniref:carbohydrate ABC transporter permease n=1 Tax=Haloarcula marina TaxID=2961574 RepID=UPI0020B7616D|nr:carbohydrate ABC transporter permease [Halomicroarcula marina]
MGGTESQGKARSSIWGRFSAVGFHCLIWSLVFVVLLPISWPLLLSLHAVPSTTILDRGVTWWLRGIQFDAFAVTVFHTPFLRLLSNSVIVSTAAAFLSTALAVTSAYGINRFDFAGRRFFAGSLLVQLMVPNIVIAIPLLLIFRTIGLFNSHLGLVIAYVAFTLPFMTWLLLPIFSNIPTWLEDAARIDGCSRLGAFLWAFLPAAKPALAAAFTFAWVISYNELLFAVILLNDPAKRTLPVGYSYGVGDIGVASLLASFPALLIFAVLWRYFLQGDLRRLAG